MNCCRSSTTWRLTLLMELQQAASHGFIISMSRRLYFVHMDHSESHDGGKIQEKFDQKGPVHCPHPPYSPNLNLCDFWFFGIE
jgi:hypothetical protein